MNTTEMVMAMQRASEAGPHGHHNENAGQGETAGWFKKAREKHAAMSADEHAARRFGRNPKGFTPNAV